MTKLNTKQAAAFLGVSYYYLRNLRQGLHPHDGPKCTPIGANPIKDYEYEIPALQEWAAKHTWRKRRSRVRKEAA